MFKKLHKIAAATLSLLILTAGTGLAQTVASSPCDTKYFDSLKSRAWLEAQREITQNQNLIFKPDSVFEYTCFDKFANELADHAKDMFSETQRWGPIPGITITSMDTALDNLVGQALISYINQNFEYADSPDKTKPPPPDTPKKRQLLGGRIEGTEEASDYTPKAINGIDPTRKHYDCDRMNMVWKIAKCMNFIQNTTNDGFYTFQEYRDSSDKRFLPTICSGVESQWKQEIKTATVNGDPPDGTPWKEDLVATFFEKISPTTLACADMTPIETGVIVTRPHDDPQVFPEGVCVPAGCYAVPDSGGSLTCKNST